MTAWPTEIRLSKDKRLITVSFDDGSVVELGAELLRVFSPSAEVQGHSAAERKTVGGKQSVAIRDVQPVGNYAVRLVFDDGHDTGLYSFAYLATLGAEKEERWARYLSELNAKGLARDRPGEA